MYSQFMMHGQKNINLLWWNFGVRRGCSQITAVFDGAHAPPPHSVRTIIPNSLKHIFLLSSHLHLFLQVPSSFRSFDRLCKCFTCLPFFTMAQQLQWAKASSLTRIHDNTESDTPHPVGLLWTSDQPEAETSTWQHTTLTRDRHQCPRQDSNPQSQQASDRKPTP